MARSDASRSVSLVCVSLALSGVGMVADTSKTRRSKNGTRDSSEWAMDILSVFNRMSPTSQKYRSTYRMRVVSSRSLTSAYTGAVSCWGVGALQPPRSSWARSSTVKATPLALV